MITPPEESEDDSEMEENQELPKTISPPVMETIHEEHEEIAVKEKEKASKMAEKEEKEEEKEKEEAKEGEKEEEEKEEEVTPSEEKPADVSSVVNETGDLPLKESAESTEQSNTAKGEEKETDENTGATRQEEGGEKSESASPEGGTSGGQEEKGQQDIANEEVGVVLKEDEQRPSDIVVSRYLCLSFLTNISLSSLSLSLTCYLTHTCTFLCLLCM